MSQRTQPHHWTEVTLAVPEGWGELVTDELAAWAGNGRVSLESSGAGVTARAWRPCSTPAGEPHFTEPGSLRPVATATGQSDAGEASRELVSRFADLARRSGCPELAEILPTVRCIPDSDWSSTWRTGWHPFRVGRVVILPAGHEAPLRSDDVVLRLNPGGAFGTGRHGSTRGCLKALQRQLVPGQRLIDAGCGSGILAVAAALLGAEEVTAFDLDIDAVRHTDRLAREHGVGDRVVLAHADLDLLERLDRPTDGLLANIDESVLVANASKMRHCLRAGAWFALGGTRADVHDQLSPALIAEGLEVERVDASARWRTHIGRRPRVGHLAPS